MLPFALSFLVFREVYGVSDVLQADMAGDSTDAGGALGVGVAEAVDVLAQRLMAKQTARSRSERRDLFAGCLPLCTRGRATSPAR